MNNKKTYSTIEVDEHNAYLCQQRDEVLKHHPELDKDNPDIMKNLLTALRCSYDSRAGKTVEKNEAIFTNDILKNNNLWKVARKNCEMKFQKIFIMCYHRSCPLHVTALYSTQPAKIIENLRKLGFLFKQRQTERKTYYEFKNEQGVRCREIYGFGLPLVLPESNYIQLSKKLEIALLKKYTSVISGIRPVVLDHRIPIKAATLQNRMPITAIDVMVYNGSYIEYFQFLTEKENDKKREACGIGQEGHEIPIPDGVPKNAYKRYCGESCDECYWNNLFIVYNKKDFPDYAREMKKQWEQEKEKAKAYGKELEQQFCKDKK